MSAEKGAPLLEVVSGQILLGRREEFWRLHRETLTPLLDAAGIKAVQLMTIELGRYQRFFNIYEYDGWHEYWERTEKLLQNPRLAQYYRAVSDCIDGAITVEIAISERRDVETR